MARLAGELYRVSVIVAVSAFLMGVFLVVYEVRMWNNAEALRKQIDSGQLSADDGAKAYQLLAGKSLFSWPLYPARNSLRDRYVAEADRVIADYREASESTPVYARDWKRAQAALTQAVNIAPDDKSIRGKSKVIDGHLKLRAADVKGSRSAFEDARHLLPNSPDPHLGLAMIHMSDSDLDKAEDELREAQRDGFRPGRREQKALADAYRKRGERWIARRSGPMTSNKCRMV